MKEVLDLLDSKNIKYKLIEHEEVFTVDDMNEHGLLDEGYVCKNLFLRNANGKMHFVVSCHHDKEVDVQTIAKKLGSTRLSFGSDERLDKYLKLKHGYVSPFGVLNDESESVIFVFDRELKGKENVGFHPNTNKATIYLKFDDVKKIVQDHGNDVVFISI